MNKKINPVAAVVIAVVVLAGVGFASMKLFGPERGALAAQTVVKISNPDDPKYQADPKLGGGR